MKFQCAIFDKDGTLIDSEKAIFENYKVVLKEHGIDFPLSVYQKMLGVKKEESDRVIYEFLGNRVDKSIVQLAEEEMLKERFLKYGVPIKKGVVNFLEFLTKNNIICAVATSSVKDKTMWQLEQTDLKKYFQVIVTGDMVKNSKPAPDIFLETARLANMKPESCIGFEDSVAGILSIKNAKMTAVHIKDLTPVNDIIRKNADYCYSSFDDIPHDILINSFNLIEKLENF